MSDAPRFLKSDEMPAPAGHWLQATHPVWPPAVMALVFATLAVGAMALAIVERAPWWAYPLVLLWSAAMGGLAQLFWGVFRAARRPTNWLLRADDSGIYLKIRSYRNHAIVSDEPDVVFLPRAAIAFVCGHVQMAQRRSSRGNVVKQKNRLLDIKLADDEWLAAIRKQVGVERRLWVEHGRSSRSRHGHYPVSAGHGAVHVGWRNSTDSVRPPLERMLAELARWYRIEGETASDDPGVVVPMSKDQEERLVALLEAGEKIEAVKLARELYGLGLKDAKDFVEQLQGR